MKLLEGIDPLNQMLLLTDLLHQLFRQIPVEDNIYRRVLIIVLDAEIFDDQLHRLFCRFYEVNSISIELLSSIL